MNIYGWAATVVCGYALYVLSTPIHEISHWVVLRMLGYASRLEIVFFSFTNEHIGEVQPENGRWEFYEGSFMVKRPRIGGFLVGFSGGGGAAVALLAIAGVVHYQGYSGLVFWSCAVGAIAQFLHAHLEGIRSMRSVAES